MAEVKVRASGDLQVALAGVGDGGAEDGDQSQDERWGAWVA